MSEWKDISYPKMFVSLSKELSEFRSKLSENIYKEGTEQYRGNRESEISQLGILAELISQHFLTEQDLEFTSAPIIDVGPVVMCDIVLAGFGNDYLIDVKGVKKDDDTLRVNYNAHNNQNKKTTHYLFVHILTSCTARYKWFTNDEVSSWNVSQSTYSKVYSNPI